MPRAKFLSALAVAGSLLLLAPSSLFAQKAAAPTGAAVKPAPPLCASTEARGGGRSANSDVDGDFITTLAELEVGGTAPRRIHTKGVIAYLIEIGKPLAVLSPKP